MKNAKRAKKPQEPVSAPKTSPVVQGANREKLRSRAVGLVARAAHAATPEEEARTSAVVAAKIIHAEKFLEAAGGREHALFERLEGLDDHVLNDVALVVEEALAAGGIVRDIEQASRWRSEAKYLQQKLDAFAGGLRWILQGYKLGLAERPGQCSLCGRGLQHADVIAWKRRRADAAHYTCCIAALHRHGAIPS